MVAIQQMIDDLLNDNQAAALAMVVQVEGSAYRKEGTWMVLKENGEKRGMISGGCLENDLHKQAERLFHSGKAELVTYDLSSEDDAGWGRGAGCNGTVSILIRDVDETFRQALNTLRHNLQRKEPVLWIQSMTDYTKYALSSRQDDPFEFWDEDPAWPWNGAAPFYQIATQKKIAGETYYLQLIWPQPNLYILGAGADARPLARFAADAGYAVHLFDWREALLNKKQFPTASSIRIGNLKDLLEGTPFSPLDSVIIMTHDFQQDVAIMKVLKDVKLLYRGMLGSKARTERILGGPIPDDFHSPVGLPIGAEGPEEIAISIVAELIAKRRGKKT